MWDAWWEWFLSLGAGYGVNPLVFGAIYIGAVPLFTLSIAWLVRNIRQKKPIVLPLLAASCCFVSAYVYLIIAGKNIPPWVYVVLVVMVLYGAYSTFAKVRGEVRRRDPSEADGDGSRRSKEATS